MKKTYIKPEMNVIKTILGKDIATGIAVGSAFSGTSSDIQSKERGSRTADDFDDLW